MQNTTLQLLSEKLQKHQTLLAATNSHTTSKHVNTINVRLLQCTFAVSTRLQNTAVTKSDEQGGKIYSQSTI